MDTLSSPFLKAPLRWRRFFVSMAWPHTPTPHTLSTNPSVLSLSSLSFSCTLSPMLALMLTLILTFTLTLFNTHFYTYPRHTTLSLALMTQNFFALFAHTHTHSYTLTHTHTHSHVLTHTNIHSHTHTHTHSPQVCRRPTYWFLRVSTFICRKSTDVTTKSTWVSAESAPLSPQTPLLSTCSRLSSALDAARYGMWVWVYLWSGCVIYIYIGWQFVFLPSPLMWFSLSFRANEKYQSLLNFENQYIILQEIVKQSTPYVPLSLSLSLSLSLFLSLLSLSLSAFFSSLPLNPRFVPILNYTFPDFFSLSLSY